MDFHQANTCAIVLARDNSRVIPRRKVRDNGRFEVVVGGIPVAVIRAAWAGSSPPSNDKAADYDTIARLGEAARANVSHL